MYENFEEEKTLTDIDVSKVVERTIAATKISKHFVSIIKSEEELNRFPEQKSIVRERKSKVPQIFVSIIRNITMELIVKEKMPNTFKNIFKNYVTWL